MPAEHFGVIRKRQHDVHGCEHVFGVPFEESTAATNEDGVTGECTSIDILINFISIAMHLELHLLALSLIWIGGFNIINNMSFRMAWCIKACDFNFSIK